MRLLPSLLFGLVLSACGSPPPAEETPREEHGGKQPTDGSGTNVTVACTKPQLELKGKLAGFNYERTVRCSEVSDAFLQKLDDHTLFTVRKTGLDQAKPVLEITFEEAFDAVKYTGPAHVVLRFPDDALVGNCPGQYHSTATTQDLVTGSFAGSDLYYLDADGACGQTVLGQVTGRWTTKP